jgi:hypothetical protein
MAEINLENLPDKEVDLSGLPDEGPAELEGKIPSLYGPSVSIDIDRYRPFTGGKIETVKPVLVDIDRKRIRDAYVDAATMSALTGGDIKPSVAYDMHDAMNQKHLETVDSWGKVLTKSSLAVGPSLFQGAAGLVRETEEFLQPDIPGVATETPEGYLGPTPIRTNLGETAGDFWEKRLRAVDVNAGSNQVKRYAGLITTNVIQNLPFLGVGVLAKSSTIPLIGMGLVTKGQKYQNLRSRGMDENTARLMSTVVGISEAATEKFGLDALIKSGIPFSKRLLLNTSLEVPGELINTSVEAAADKVSIEPGMTYEDYVKALTETAIVTLGSAGALTTISHPLVLMRDSQEKKENVISGEDPIVLDTTKQDLEFNKAFEFPDMPATVESTYNKAREEALLNNATEEAATDIAIEAAKQTEEGQAYFAEAEANLQPVEIAPVEETFRRILEEDLTEEQLQEILAEISPEDLQDVIQGAVEEGVAAPVSAVKQRLIDVGMSETEATSNAALFDGFRVLAKRAGVDPDEVMSKFLPEISREAPVVEITDEVRKQVAANPVLSERFTTEEQLTNPEILRNVREDISNTLETQREELDDEQIAEMEEAIGFIDGRISDKPEILEQTVEEKTPRGRIRFAPTGINIELLENADKSTFLHETGHLYFRMMRDLAELETASQDLKDDFETLKDWLNYEDGQISFTREQEEQFARGFEAYLREGKAPTSALKQAFENFKQWLMEVYQDLLELNVELTDSVRDVMGRLLADEGVEVRGPPAEVPAVEEAVLEQPRIPKKITNIRQLAKKLGGIDFNREQLKGELNKLKEDAPATRFIINKKDKGVTLDVLLGAAIDENILGESADLNDLLDALEKNLQTQEAIEEEIAKDERIRRKLEGKEFELGELKKAFVDASVKARKAFREGKKVGEIKEAKKLKNILARARKVRLVRDYFNLTDAELKSISKKNPLLLSQYEFKLYLDNVRKKAVLVEEKNIQKAILMKQIYDKDFKRVDNYRRVLGFPAYSKMTTNQLKKFSEALEPFSEGDTFLSERQLETVDRTDLKGIKTYREAKERLAKEVGVSIDELETIRVKEWDDYKWDTALAEANPFYRMLVTETTRKLLEGELRFHQIEDEVFDLARKSEKSRGRTLVEKAIPQDPQIFAYIQTPIDERQEIAETMTPEQLDYAHYMESYFQIALEYLIRAKSLERGRQNYFRHVRKAFLENVKDNGLIRGFKDIFKSYQEDEATFNILDDDTGNILPLDKFVPFQLERIGGVDPTTNVTKAFLDYARIMEMKISFDELIPKVDIYAQSLTPEVYTPRGLEIDRSLKQFVNKYINNKKGRRIRWIAKQGGVIDVSTRGLRTFTTLIDLGFNIPSGIAAFVGERVTNFQMLGVKGYNKGLKRSQTKKGKRILKKYEAFVGRSAWENFTAPGKQVTERIEDGLFYLFHQSSINANKVFLLGAITENEYNTEEITSERLAILQLEMGRFRVVPGTKSLVGSTSAGSAFVQYKTWAAPIIRTLSKDATKLVNDLAKKPTGEALTTKEAREIYRFIGLTVTALIVGALALAESDDDSFTGQVLKRVYRESMTLLQGVDPSLWLATPRLMGFITQLGKNLKAIATLEEYKTKSGLKGLEGLQRQLTPRAIKQFEEKPKKELKL